MKEARLEDPGTGLAPTEDGWFVVNVRDATWLNSDEFGSGCIFDSHGAWFKQVGVNISVLLPGEPNCLYHSESQQEAFLVLSGSASCSSRARSGLSGNGTSSTARPGRSTSSSGPATGRARSSWSGHGRRTSSSSTPSRSSRRSTAPARRRRRPPASEAYARFGGPGGEAAVLRSASLGLSRRRLRRPPGL